MSRKSGEGRVKLSLIGWHSSPSPASLVRPLFYSLKLFGSHGARRSFRPGRFSFRWPQLCRSGEALPSGGWGGAPVMPELARLFPCSLAPAPRLWRSGLAQPEAGASNRPGFIRAPCALSTTGQGNDTKRVNGSTAESAKRPLPLRGLVCVVRVRAPAGVAHPCIIVEKPYHKHVNGSTAESAKRPHTPPGER